MSGSGTASTITLRALEGQPLADERTRETVLAAAAAIAERHGIEVLITTTTPTSITVTLRTGRIEAIGFAAELRRITTKWYTEKYGEQTLWGEARDPDDDDDDDDADAWKRA